MSTDNIPTNDSVIPFLIKILPVVIIGGMTAAAFYYLWNSPIAKELRKLFGGVTGLLGAIDKQFETCNDVGWFNLTKGCYSGWTVIGIAVLFAGFTVYRKFGGKGSKPNKEIEEAAETKARVEGISQDAAMDKIITLSNAKELIETPLRPGETQNVRDLVTLRTIITKTTADIVKIEKSLSKTPSEIADAHKNNYEKWIKSTDSKYSKEEIEKADELTEDIPDPFESSIEP